MGRGLLIMTLGLSIVLGMIQIGVQNRQLSADSQNVGYFNQTHVQNIAASSLEYGLNKFNQNPGWRTAGNPDTFTMIGVQSEIHVDDNISHPDDLQGNQIRIRALAEVDNRTARSEAILQFESIFPPIPGAMGFYGEDSELDIRGNVTVIGHDMNPDGTEGEKQSLPGIVAEVESDSLMVTSGQAYTLDGEPPFSVQDLDGQELQDFIVDFMAVADLYSAPDVGSVENPKIVKMPEGNTEISDKEGGAGIIIVPPDATLSLRGSFSYQGLLIIQGKLDIAGNVAIYGSALFGDNALLEIEEVDPNDATLKGNTMIQYSSSALENVDRALGVLLNRGFSISGIYE